MHTPVHPGYSPLSLRMMPLIAVVSALVFSSSPAHASQATHFALTNVTLNLGAGTTTGVTVQALDSNNLPVVGFGGTVHFTSTDPNAVLPADYTFNPVVDLLGQHVFSGVSFKTAGAQQLIATAGTVVGSVSGIVVNPGPISSLKVEGASGGPIPSQIVNTPFNVKLTALDAFGNVATAFTGTSVLTSTGTLLGTPLTTGNFVAGVLNSQPVTMTVAEPGVLLRAANLGSIGDSVPFDVSTGVPTHLKIVAPSTATSGVPTNVTVSAMDANNARVSTYAGTVTFNSNDPQAVLPSPTAFTLADSGSRVFPVTFNSAALRSIGVTSLLGSDSTNVAVSNLSAAVNSIAPSKSATAGGAAVTITGSQFLPGATVSLGGLSAQDVTVDSLTQITFTAPAHSAGQVDLVVTNPAASPTTVANAFTYNDPPVLLSQPTYTPANPVAGQPVAFSVPASDPQQKPLTITYDYGDGTIDTLATHTWVSPGVYNVTITISDGIDAITWSAKVTVQAPGSGTSDNYDSDGDGVPDWIELIVGTNPFDPNSSPFTTKPGPIQTLNIKSLQIRLNFSKNNNDSIKMMDLLPIPAGFNGTNQKLTTYIGGVLNTVTLDKKGLSKFALGAVQLKLKLKNGVAPLQFGKLGLKMAHCKLASTFASSGLNNTDAYNVQTTVLCFVLFNNTIYLVKQPQSYTAKKDHIGCTK